MSRSRLTALAVERAFRNESRFMLGDGDGLYLRKQGTSGASWTLRYRFAERERWMTLGNYPDMSLADARIQARAKRTLVDRQVDPLDERNEAKRARVEVDQRERSSFKALAMDWYETEICHRIKYPQIPLRYINRQLLPAFGSMQPSEVTPADAARLLARVSRKTPAAANDLLRFKKRIFRFGVRRRLLPISPVADFVSRDAGGPERPRERALSQDELVILLKAMRESPVFGELNYLFVKLLLALGVRKGELVRATWEEFDLDGPSPTWRLPASRSKTKRAIRIPLVPTVVDWLRAMKAIEDGSGYVFPQRRRCRRTRVPHLGMDTVNAAVKHLNHGIEPFTLHDLRRTMRSHLAALGVRSEVAERCLNHQLRGVERIYNTHDYFDERRAALETWTDLLLDIESGVQKVTPIRRAQIRMSDMSSGP